MLLCLRRASQGRIDGDFQPDGTFAVDPNRVKEGVAGLTRDIMTIQAEGDYAAAKALGM